MLKQAHDYSTIENEVSSIIHVPVLDIDHEFITVGLDKNSTGILSKAELFIGLRKVSVEIGDLIEVVPELQDPMDKKKVLRVSWELARRILMIESFRMAMKNRSVVYGSVQEKEVGGYSGNINGVKVFIPNNHIGDKNSDFDIKDLQKDEQPFIILSIEKNQETNHDIIVASRRDAFSQKSLNINKNVLERLNIGETFNGRISRILDNGCYVQLLISGFDIFREGFLSLADSGWQDIDHPSEVVSIEDEIKVKILDIDKDSMEIFLGVHYPV